MKKCFIILVILLGYSTGIKCQSIENTINLYATNFQQEKIHIHFDKETYLPGETIWFKAYILEENLPSTRSTNFYIALYNEKGEIIQKQLCPIFGFSAAGHFDIPDSLQDKQLICKAYTVWMLNFDNDFLFTKNIPLINNKAKGNGIVLKTVSLQFFPEGGDIITGLTNTIAFKASYNDGMPFEMNGVIKKVNTGEIVVPIKSQHNGMGKFDLMIDTTESFYAEWTDDKDTLQKTFLPNAKISGVSLKVSHQKDKIFFNLINKSGADSLHVLMYMYQKIFYKDNIIAHADEPYTATVPLKHLPSGTAQLTIFNSNWQPVAERIFFINNNEYEVNAKITSTTTSLQKRGKNIIEIVVPDTVPANMSLSITDADVNSNKATSNIITDFLLSGDVKGFISDPAYYFSNDKDAGKNLDLVMLTHGWRRYNWDNIVNAKMPEIKYAADNYLSVSGQVNKKIINKLDSNEAVSMIIVTKDSTQNFYQIKPDANGLVKKDGMIFYDSVRVLYSFKKNKLLNTSLRLDSSNHAYSFQNQIYDYNKFIVRQVIDSTKYNPTATLFNYYLNNVNTQKVDKDGTLQTVIVKSGGWRNWKNNPMLKMDERYTSGQFRGGAIAESFDVAHDVTAWAKGDIYNYLIGKIPGIYIDYNAGRQIMHTDKKGIIFFIDENEVDNYQLSQLNIESVGYIKFIPIYAGYPGFPHAIAIYRKKGQDLNDYNPKETNKKIIKVNGYSPIKEFYSPDYSLSNTTLGTDARTTLLWQPYIITDKNNLKVPIVFYNNDFSKRLRIMLEGITEDGKLIHIERVLE